MNYQEAVAFLNDLCNFGINLGLDRINKLLEYLDHPHQKIKTIHVAGTNGKGSTIAILASILREEGYRVGVYTSPHLHSYTERISINNEGILPDDFGRLMARVKEQLPKVLENTGESPTEFEVLTAMALKYFYQQKVDIAIMEVGMGGRLDSTNVILPEVSIITSIGHDHMEFLGSSLAQIAKEKAGIIKRGIPVVVGKQEPEVLEVIKEQALKLAAPLSNLSQASYKQLEYSFLGQRFELKTKEHCYQDLSLGLIGDHQLDNAVNAMGCIEVLQSLGWQITQKSIVQGMAKAKWPGRLEYFDSKPPIVLDGAHNIQGARALAKALKKYFPYNRLIMVIAILDDKDQEEIIQCLAPIVETFIVTRVPNNTRNKNWHSLQNVINAYDKEIIIEEDIEQAIKIATGMGTNQDLVAISGSLYLIGEARQYVLKYSPLA